MRKWLPWAMVVAAFAFSIAVYSRLPERVPIHFGPDGSANGWSGRGFAAFLMPIIMVVLAAVLPSLPKIDPRRANYEKFQPTYDFMIAAVIGLQLVIHVAMLGSAMGWPMPMQRIVPIGVGVMFVLLGNVLPRARPNWLFGIRTPWTLSSDRVWEKTHRVGGYLFVVGGIVMMAVAFLPVSFLLPGILSTAVISAVVPIVYSYFAWKQEMVR